MLQVAGTIQARFVRLLFKKNGERVLNAKGEGLSKVTYIIISDEQFIDATIVTELVKTDNYDDCYSVGEKVIVPVTVTVYNNKPEFCRYIPEAFYGEHF